MHTINSLAERLLGRSLTKNDGVKPSELDKIEIKLGTTLPNILRDLYLLVGKNNMLMESFNRFALPSQLQKDGNKIVFLEANQNICYWGMYMIITMSESIICIFLQERKKLLPFIAKNTNLKVYNRYL